MYLIYLKVVYNRYLVFLLFYIWVLDKFLRRIVKVNYLFLFLSWAFWHIKLLNYIFLLLNLALWHIKLLNYVILILIWASWGVKLLNYIFLFVSEAV
jgi:hypothetical protein